MKIREYVPYYKRNIKVAYPIMLAQAGQVSVQLVDSIMVGHVGTPELAASSFANSIFIIGFVFGMGFTFGLTPLVGQAFGAKEYKRVGELFRNSFILNVIISIFLAFLMFGISFLMPYMGQPKEVVILSIPYYRILVISMIPFLLFYTIKQYLEGLGKTKAATIITILANIINVIFNYIFIFGHFGVSELGLNGAGWATLISRILMPILLIMWFVKTDYYVKYKEFIFTRIKSLKEIYSLFIFNLPIGLQIVVEVIAFAIGGVMMGWYGETALAAHQIALGLASFTFMIASGIGSATTIRVSFQLGSRKFIKLRNAGFASIHLIIVFMSLTAILFLVLRHILPEIFTLDKDVIELASYLLIFAAIFQIVDGIQLVSISALRALSDVKFALWFSIFTYGFLALGSSYTFAFFFDLGPKGIWFGYVTGLSVASIVFLIRFNKLTKRLVHTDIL